LLIINLLFKHGYKFKNFRLFFNVFLITELIETTKLFPRLCDSKHVFFKKKEKIKVVDQIWADLLHDLTEISACVLFPCCGKDEKFCQMKYLMWTRSTHLTWISTLC